MSKALVAGKAGRASSLESEGEISRKRCLGLPEHMTCQARGTVGGSLTSTVFTTFSGLSYCPHTQFSAEGRSKGGVPWPGPCSKVGTELGRRPAHTSVSFCETGVRNSPSPSRVVVTPK